MLFLLIFFVLERLRFIYWIKYESLDFFCAIIAIFYNTRIFILRIQYNSMYILIQFFCNNYIKCPIFRALFYLSNTNKEKYLWLPPFDSNLLMLDRHNLKFQHIRCEFALTTRHVNIFCIHAIAYKIASCCFHATAGSSNLGRAIFNAISGWIIRIIRLAH